MSIDIRVPSMTEMRQFVDEYLVSHYPKTQVSHEVFDDETVQEMYNEVNSKYKE